MNEEYGEREYYGQTEGQRSTAALAEHRYSCAITDHHDDKDPRSSAGLFVHRKTGLD